MCTTHERGMGRILERKRVQLLRASACPTRIPSWRCEVPRTGVVVAQDDGIGAAGSPAKGLPALGGARVVSGAGGGFGEGEDVGRLKFGVGVFHH
jgi:hypothetical protein